MCLVYQKFIGVGHEHKLNTFYVKSKRHSWYRPRRGRDQENWCFIADANLSDLSLTGNKKESVFLDLQITTVLHL